MPIKFYKDASCWWLLNHRHSVCPQQEYEDTQPWDVDSHLRVGQFWAGFEEVEVERELDAVAWEANSSFVWPAVCGDPPEPSWWLSNTRTFLGILIHLGVSTASSSISFLFVSSPPVQPTDGLWRERQKRRQDIFWESPSHCQSCRWLVSLAKCPLQVRHLLWLVSHQLCPCLLPSLPLAWCPPGVKIVPTPVLRSPCLLTPTPLLAPGVALIFSTQCIAMSYNSNHSMVLWALFTFTSLPWETLTIQRSFYILNLLVAMDMST